MKFPSDTHMDWWYKHWNTCVTANNQISFAPYYNLSGSDLAKTIGEHLMFHISWK